jgi:hypothetical protein
VTEHGRHSTDGADIDVWCEASLDAEHLGVRDPDHRTNLTAAQPRGHPSETKFTADPMDQLTGAACPALDDRFVRWHVANGGGRRLAATHRPMHARSSRHAGRSSAARFVPARPPCPCRPTRATFLADLEHHV